MIEDINKNNTIPDIYRWSGNYRFISPVGKQLDPLDFSQIACPQCGKMLLAPHYHNVPNGLGGYSINCSSCHWTPHIYIEECPTEEAALEALKTWVEAYKLLGEPKKMLQEDARVMLGDPDTGEAPYLS